MVEPTVSDTILIQRLEEMEGLRKKARKRVLAGFGVLLLAVSYFILVVVLTENGGSFLMFLGGILVWGGILIVVFLWANKATSEYKDLFKDQIVREIIRRHNPEWQYFPEKSISTEDYYESELFKTRHDRFNGDDYVEGAEGDTMFAFSELHTEYKTEHRDSKGHKSTSWHTIFRGLFLFAEFNKAIQGRTFVLPDSLQGFLGRFGQKLQSWNKSHGELVKLENIEFEKHFVVYSSSQIEARYILTPRIMENLVDFREKWKHKLHLSFKGTRMYFAAGFNESLFEPRLFTSGVRPEDLQKMKHLLDLVSSIIKEMGLNTRIWTVQ